VKVCPDLNCTDPNCGLAGCLRLTEESHMTIIPSEVLTKGQHNGGVPGSRTTAAETRHILKSLDVAIRNAKNTQNREDYKIAKRFIENGIRRGANGGLSL